jgi:hypothetical protein
MTPFYVIFMVGIEMTRLTHSKERLIEGGNQSKTFTIIANDHSEQIIRTTSTLTT